jgi:hypothetical protein
MQELWEKDHKDLREWHLLQMPMDIHKLPDMAEE